MKFADVFKYWFDMQIKEQLTHQLRFPNEKPTVVSAANFNPNNDAEELFASMDGVGTDEEAIAQILAKRNVDQRLKIQKHYKELCDSDLLDDLKKDLSGVYEKVIVALMKPLPLLLAEAVEAATKGAGTDEDALIEIFCTRDDESVQSIKKTFEECYGRTIEEAVTKETSGAFQKILVSILSKCREDGDLSPHQVVDTLTGADVAADHIHVVFTAYSFGFLNKVFTLYKEKKGKEITELITEKCEKDCQNALLAIYQCSKSRPEFYARALNKAMKGFGTDDSALIRIIVSRCEIDLKSIMEKYEEIFEGTTLQDDLKSDTSGDFEKVLLYLIGC